MSFKTLTFKKKAHTALIALIEAAKDMEAIIRISDELTDLCNEITVDEGLRVVILSGSLEQGTFSLDLPEKGSTQHSRTADQIKRCSISKPVASLDKPVIAAIHQDAVGLDLEMAMACDLRIAAKTARFGLPYIKSGLIPWDGGTQRLTRLVGTGKALEMILTGVLIDADEAERIGLINRVVSSEELMETAEKIADDMATSGPTALRYAKEAIGKGMDLTLEQGLRLEADLYFLLHTTEDRTEGIRAFQEKRPPHFKDN